MRENTMKYLFYRKAAKIDNEVIAKDHIRVELTSGKAVRLIKSKQLITLIMQNYEEQNGHGAGQYLRGRNRVLYQRNRHAQAGYSKNRSPLQP